MKRYPHFAHQRRTKSLPFVEPNRRDVLRALGGLALTMPLGGLFGGPLFAADEPSKTQADKLPLRFAKYYKPVKVDANPAVPAYDLPLDLGKVANFKDVAQKLGLADDEPSLKKNGFAVIPGKGNEDIVEPYENLKSRDIPIVITADTLLHLYHVQFDETLKDIEEREFYKDVVALTDAMIAKLDALPVPEHDDTPGAADFTPARKKALTFFAVGRQLLKPGSPLPERVDKKDVDEVLEKVKAHEGFWPDPFTRPNSWGLFRYSEDFSQYVPRGHYTRSETLKKYFVGMMWFGRMTFLLKGHTNHSIRGEALVSPEEATWQTLTAALITKALAEAALADGRKAQDVWERVYAVTSFYVGLADDLGYAEYQSALKKVCGAALDLAALLDEDKQFAFKKELARHTPPAIYSGTGAIMAQAFSGGPAELDKALDKTMGFRFMGQRFVPDSYMMGKLVYPSVGDPTRDKMFTRVMTPGGPVRGFPRGLDVMTILGSKRARALLHELEDDAYAHTGKGPSYDEALDALKKEYAGLKAEDWNRNLYWSWLYALQPLLAEYGAGYPTFMTTTAYRTKSLNTALASWAQLRHDTILYAKQSYTMFAPDSAPIPKPPIHGYVEPLAEFYARLLALSRMTNQGLTEMKVLDPAAKTRLGEFEKILERLLAISEKELLDKKLTDDDYRYIEQFAEHLEGVVVPPNAKGESQAMKTTLVADVHTDQNSGHVLEEGTGYVDLAVFVYRQPDGTLAVGAGPVLSYYEFKHPMKDRLTDEKWRDLLAGKVKDTKPPSPPEWTKAYTAAKAAYALPKKEGRE
jgi:Protein of unknown function (DUF3160)